MEQKDEGSEIRAQCDEMRRIEIVSDLGLEFTGMIQTLTLARILSLRSRMQLVLQTANPALMRSIFTHETRLDFTGLPARLGNFKGFPHLLRAWFERRKQRQDILTFGTPVVGVHVVTYGPDADPAGDLRTLLESGYRMATLFEILCFVDNSGSLLGKDNLFITLKEHANGKKPKRLIMIAHCISRSHKGQLVYKTHIFNRLLEKRVREERPPTLHFVLMDANQKTITSSGDNEPPSES